MTLVCFAVKAEARPFQQLARSRLQVGTLLTGIGPRNADRAIRAALNGRKPTAVLSCGFAGGLRPELATGTIVFTADKETGWEPALLAAGAQPARFHGAERVATAAQQKRALWQATGADAVEMESQAIQAVCREQGIPSAIVRVILDTADEDLPLDFDQLLTADQRLDNSRLALALLKSPGKVGALLRLRQQSAAAADKLAQVLARLLFGPDH
jgi:adenosylhomocysteine nucleosidase